MMDPMGKEAGPKPVNMGPPVAQAEGGDPLDAAEQQHRAGVEQTIGGTAPPADEPLSGGRVNGLASSLTEAIDMLTGGEAQASIAPVQGDLDQLPPDLFVNLTVMSSMLDSMVQSGIKAAARYQFDPAELGTTGRGLDKMQAMFTTMANDQKLIAAMKRPMQPPAAGKPAPDQAPVKKGAEDDLEGLM